MGRSRAAGAVLCVVLVFASLDGHAASTNKDVWAEKWCELNDCYGIRAAEERQGAVAKVDREARVAFFALGSGITWHCLVVWALGHACFITYLLLGCRPQRPSKPRDSTRVA
jgi:hypothetical protein